MQTVTIWMSCLKSLSLMPQFTRKAAFDFAGGVGGSAV
jgi:hypothetical protein